MSFRAPALCAVLLVALLGLGCTGGGGGGSGGSSSGGSGSGGSVTNPQVLRAGAAAVDLAPPPGTPLAGFGAAPRRVVDITTIPLMIMAAFGSCVDPDPSTPATFFAPAQGTLDPVMARALVIDNGTRKVAIVKLDTIGITGQVRGDLAAVATTLGIAPEDLVVCGTHTHSGPAAVGDWRLWSLVAADCYNDQAYQAVKNAAVDALVRANAALRPAEIGIGSVLEYNASHNRRGRPGLYDPEVGVVKIVEPGTGAPIAALINFAVHGTCLGASSMVFSADCMGAIEREVEKGLGGGIAIFTNGAEGDVSPAQGGVAGIQYVGQTVGAAVLGLWPSIAPKPWVRLQGAIDEVPMPPAMLQPGCFPIPGSSDTICDIIPGFSVQVPIPHGWFPDRLPFQAIRIDDAVFATVPGEPITELGWDIKARAKAKGFAHAFVIGLANEHGSYFTTFAEYMRGEYEGMASLYGPANGDIVVQSADAVVDRVR